MNRDEYYAECISIAADECELVITPDQIKYLADAVAGSVENESMAFGHDVATTNLRAFEDRKVSEIKQRLEYEQTVPRKRCNTCSGHGTLTDSWGREFGCSDCRGKGSTPLYPFKLST